MYTIYIYTYMYMYIYIYVYITQSFADHPHQSFQAHVSKDKLSRSAVSGAAQLPYARAKPWGLMAKTFKSWASAVPEKW